MNDKSSIKKSIFIVGLEKLSMIFFQFITAIILARLLMPSDFGTVAMLSIFMSLASTLVDSGFGGSLVYYKDVGEKDYSTVFWLNLSVSLCLYVLMFISAEQIATFYKLPILAKLIKVLGLSVVFSSIGLVQYSILYKNLEFKKIATISVVAYLISAIIAIYLAYTGMGVWALIAQQVLGPLLRTSAFVFINRFIPKFYFSRNIVIKHWHFGGGLFFSAILKVVYDNMYVQLIGKYCSIVNAGYYNQAKRLKDIPQELFSKTFETSLFPILSKLTDDSIFTNKLQRITRVFAFLSSLLFFIISILSDEIIKILLGEKWLPSSWILEFISVGAIFYIFETISRSALKAKGLSMLIFKIDLIKRSFFIIVMILLVSYLDVKGMVIAFIINSFVGWCINSYYLSLHIPYTFFNQLTDVLKYVLTGIIIFIGLSMLKEYASIQNNYYTVFVFGIVFLLSYTLLNVIIRDETVIFIYQDVKKRWIKKR